MSKVDMAVNLGGIAMKNPVNTASGTFGFGKQFAPFMDVSALGAITTKGCSAVAWPGNPQPRLAEVTSGMLNSVGLQNPSAKGMCEQFGEYLSGLSQTTAVICQVAGHTVEEYAQALEIFEEEAPWAAGFELNVSCPNVSRGGCAIGSTPEGAAEVLRACRPLTKRPLLVKMAPVRIPEIARACEEAGADALTVINSIPAMAIDVHTRRSRLSRPTGGMSGPALRPIALRMAWEACQAVSIPVCGVGGIMTGEDAAQFILAGCTAVSVGMASLVEPGASVRILHELERWAAEQGVASISELRGALEE